eukprot:745711-Hanusia_phi.AAC.1
MQSVRVPMSRLKEIPAPNNPQIQCPTTTESSSLRSFHHDQGESMYLGRLSSRHTASSTQSIAITNGITQILNSEHTWQDLVGLEKDITQVLRRATDPNSSRAKFEYACPGYKWQDVGDDSYAKEYLCGVIAELNRPPLLEATCSTLNAPASSTSDEYSNQNASDMLKEQGQNNEQIPHALPLKERQKLPQGRSHQESDIMWQPNVFDRDPAAQTRDSRDNKKGGHGSVHFVQDNTPSQDDVAVDEGNGEMQEETLDKRVEDMKVKEEFLLCSRLEALVVQAKSISHGQSDRTHDKKETWKTSASSETGPQDPPVRTGNRSPPTTSFPRLTVKEVKFKDPFDSSHVSHIDIDPMSSTAEGASEHVIKTSNKEDEIVGDGLATEAAPTQPRAVDSEPERQLTEADNSKQEENCSKNCDLSITDQTNDSKESTAPLPSNTFVGWKCDRKLLSKRPPSSIQRMIEALVLRYRSPEAIFQHFDRPELECGKGDNEITQLEFRLGVQKLNLGLPDDEINEMFSYIDDKGRGSITIADFELVLKAFGFERKVAVKKTNKSLKETQKKEVVSKADPKKKPVSEQKSLKSKELSALSYEIADDIQKLEKFLSLLGKGVLDMRQSCEQYEMISERFSQSSDCGDALGQKALADSGDELLQGMKRLNEEYKKTADEFHETCVNLIRKLPRDYRVVWKAAVCNEIDDKGVKVRELSDEMHQYEKRLAEMNHLQKQWRASLRNPHLDFTIKDQSQPELNELLANSRRWMNRAVNLGHLDEAGLVEKLRSTEVQVTSKDADELAYKLEVTKVELPQRREGGMAVTSPSAQQNGKRTVEDANVLSKFTTKGLQDSKEVGNAAQIQKQIDRIHDSLGGRMDYDAIYKSLHDLQMFRTQFENDLFLGDGVLEDSIIQNDEHDEFLELTRMEISSMVRNITHEIKLSLDTENIATSQPKKKTVPAKTGKGEATTMSSHSTDKKRGDRMLPRDKHRQEIENSPPPERNALKVSEAQKGERRVASHRPARASDASAKIEIHHVRVLPRPVRRHTTRKDLPPHVARLAGVGGKRQAVSENKTPTKPVVVSSCSLLPRETHETHRQHGDGIGTSMEQSETFRLTVNVRQFAKTKEAFIELLEATMKVDSRQAKIETWDRELGVLELSSLTLDQQRIFSSLAKDPNSNAWRMLHLLRIDAGRSSSVAPCVTDSPPRQDVFVTSHEVSPKLYSSEWEEVRASKPTADEVGEHTQSRAVSSNPARSLDFDQRSIGDEVMVEGAKTKMPSQQRKDIEYSDAKKDVKTSVPADEEGLHNFVNNYLAHHLHAQIVSTALAGRWQSEFVASLEWGEEERRSSKSMAASRLLGARGLDMLNKLGTSLEDDDVLSIAEQVIVAEAVRVMKEFRAGGGSKVDKEDRAALVQNRVHEVPADEAEQALDEDMERLIVACLLESLTRDILDGKSEIQHVQVATGSEAVGASTDAVAGSARMGEVGSEEGETLPLSEEISGGKDAQGARRGRGGGRSRENIELVYEIMREEHVEGESAAGSDRQQLHQRLSLMEDYMRQVHVTVQEQQAQGSLAREESSEVRQALGRIADSMLVLTRLTEKIADSSQMMCCKLDEAAEK